MSIDVYKSLMDTLHQSNIDIPVAWPNVRFDKKNNDEWLELAFFPNTNENLFMGVNDKGLESGIFQISIVSKKEAGIVDILSTAEDIISLYEKGSSHGIVKIFNKPSILSTLNEDDSIILPITIEYTAYR